MIEVSEQRNIIKSEKKSSRFLLTFLCQEKAKAADNPEDMLSAL